MWGSTASRPASQSSPCLGLQARGAEKATSRQNKAATGLLGLNHRRILEISGHHVWPETSTPQALEELCHEELLGCHISPRQGRREASNSTLGMLRWTCHRASCPYLSSEENAQEPWLWVASTCSLRKLRPFLSCTSLLDTCSLGKRPGSCQPLASHLTRPLGCETSAWYPSSTRLSNHWTAQLLEEHGGHERLKQQDTDATD